MVNGLPILFAETSETASIWAAAGPIIALLISQIVIALLTAVLSWLRSREDRKNSTQVATQVEGVRLSLQDQTAKTNNKLQEMREVTDATHTLVNSRMGAILDRVATLTAQVATFTGRPEDARAAERAKSDSAEHASKQKIVDDRTGS